MPKIKSTDGTQLYYEEAGTGTPVVFIHEFAGDYRTWEPQMRAFSRSHRCVTFSARGYPPSDVPEDVRKYSQNRAADDIADVLDHLQLNRAHIVGLSMGGFATLHFGFRHAPRARSLTIAGCGYGADPAKREDFRAEVANTVTFLLE
jgi:pimeloyl-ACP methyl ester carboxylesterase